MSRPDAKGWCPSAYRPMESGDGLIVRLKPRFGRFTAWEFRQIGAYATQFGNGIIDITTRANLQIRGVSEAHYPALLEALRSDNIVHRKPHYEQVNLLVSPAVSQDSQTQMIAEIIYGVCDQFKDLPAKFGFVIDTGYERQLHRASGDVRIERGYDDALLMRCDGVEAGLLTSLERLAKDLSELLNWFQEHSTAQNRRMKHLSQIVPDRWTIDKPDAPKADLPLPSDKADIIAAAYGQMKASGLAALTSGLSDDTAIYVLPNKSLMLTSGHFQKIDGYITSLEDPRLFIATCSGMPACGSAHINTHSLAEDIISEGCLPTGMQLHISACAKGCASAHPTDICITGHEDAFDIVEKGCAWQSASVKSLSRPALYGWLAQQK